MDLTYANILDRAEQVLQDAGNAIYDPTELGFWIEDELKRISKVRPLIVEVVFKIEARRGTDATGTASSLTDTVKSQFLAADATNEKVVHNTRKDTFAVVLTQTSTSVLTLSRDIMSANDTYAIYNKRCTNKRQIFIGDMPPYLEVVYVEYRGKERSFTQIGRDILELDIEDSTALDSDSTLTNINPVDVIVRFAVPHIVSQLTDLDGTLSASESEGDTAIAIENMGATEIIEVGEQFHLEDHRFLYMVATAATTSGNAIAALAIYPPLEADLASGKAITFIRSTLPPDLEVILVQLVAGRAAISKGALSLAQIATATTTLATVNTSIDNMSARLTQAIADIASGRTEADKVPAVIDKAEVAIALANAEVDQALTDVDTGRALIDLINKGGVGVPTDYINYASQDIGGARGYISEAEGSLSQARGDVSIAGNYLSQASSEISSAVGYLNQAGGYLREITSRIQVATSFRLHQDWGERRIAQAEGNLMKGVRAQPYRTLPRT